MQAVQLYRETYRSEPLDAAFCPCRVCPIGAHVDHQHGLVTGMALDRGVRLAYAPNPDGRVEVVSRQFAGRVRWRVGETPPRPAGDWADYLRGATMALARRHPLHTGLNGAIAGEMPIGGLSSSSAVIVAYLLALAGVNGLALSPEELVRLAVEAERDYVGVAVGALDPSCVVHARRDHLLFLDTRDGRREHIPQPEGMPPWEIGVFYCGLPRALTATPFNARVDEAHAAARALMAHAGQPCPPDAAPRLRDVPREVFDRCAERLPEPQRRRARHFYTECDRALKGAEAWRRGDISAYGRLTTQSGLSTVANWQTGTPPLTALFEALVRTDGVYGARFSGAGFNGCCMALIDPAFSQTAHRQVRQAYLAEFPRLAETYESFVCCSGDGAGE